MKLKSCLFLFLMIFSIGSISAQKKKKKKSKSVEIIEFGEDGDVDDGDDITLNGFIIKTSPTSYLFGSQFFEVEKYATEYLSLQAGIGLTFRPLTGDAYYNILSELDEDGGDNCDSDLWASDYCDNYTDISIRNYKPGFLISGSVRLFFDDDAMDGGYFAMKLRYSTQNFEVQEIIQNAGSVERLEDQFQSESVSRFDLIGHYGYQTLYSRLSAEYFVGLGARFLNETRQDIGQVVSGGPYQSALRSFKSSRLRIEGGIRIGFQL